MKKILGLLALAALAFASCSKDRTIDGPGKEQVATALSFTFNKPQEAYVTYAEEIASAQEWFIKDITVFAAINVGQGDEEIVKVPASYYTLEENARSFTVTINQDGVIANAGKTVSFYFVGNNSISTEGPHTEISYDTYSSEFLLRDAVSNWLVGEGMYGIDGIVDTIEKPDGSTKGLLFSAVVENVKVEGKVSKTAQLKRREARFDIKNPLHANDVFQVTEILVSNAAVATAIFPNNRVQNSTIVRQALYPIAGPATYDANGLATSAFYLYPTEMGTDKTEITVMAKFNGGTEEPYPVNASSVGGLIEANKRYIIALNPTSMTFALEVVDYDEGGELPVDVGEDDAVTLDNFDYTGYGIWNQTTKRFLLENNDVEFTFDATSKYGTEATFVDADGNPSASLVAVKTTATTYAGYTTVDSYKVTVSATYPGDKIDLKMKITAKNGTGAASIAFVTYIPDGENHTLMWDGSTNRYILYTGGFTPGLVFKYGSVVGSHTGFELTYAAAGDSGRAFASSDVVWAPSMVTPITTWDDVPYEDTDVEIDAAYHTLEHVLAGKGDPCRLVGLDLEAIGNGTSTLIDNKMWRMPACDDNVNFWSFKNGRGVQWYWYMGMTSIFWAEFPGVGGGGAGLIAAGARFSGESDRYDAAGYYWSSTPSTVESGSGYMLYFNESGDNPYESYPYSTGASVRCISQYSNY